MDAFHTIRILHLSDVHFRTDEGTQPPWRVGLVRRERWRRHRILGRDFRGQIRALAEEARPDLVCFTGDAADWGLPAEFDQATALLHGVMEDLGLGLERLFVIPGNHDIDRAIAPEWWTTLRKFAHAAGERSVSDWVAGGEPPVGIDAATLSATLDRQQSYRAWLERLGRPLLLPNPDSHPLLGYCATLALPDIPFPVHIVGLDSAWLCGDDNDEGKLMVTQDQIGRLATDQKGEPLPGLRVAMIHHPIAHLADAADARRLMADYVDLVLRGHQHDPLADVWRDPDRTLLEIAAGCLYEGSAGHRYPNGFNLIEVVTDEHGRPQRFDLRFRSWSARGHWHDDASLYRSAQNGRLSITVGTGGSAGALPLAETVRIELHDEWTACRRLGVSFQTLHKLLAVMRAAPEYVAATFDTVGTGVYPRIEAWLREQSKAHRAQGRGRSSGKPLAALDSDRTIAAARALALEEKSLEVDARHMLMALLADEHSRTIAQLRKAIDGVRAGGFETVRDAAMTTRPVAGPGWSNVAELELPSDDADSREEQ